MPDQRGREHVVDAAEQPEPGAQHRHGDDRAARADRRGGRRAGRRSCRALGGQVLDRPQRQHRPEPRAWCRKCSGVVDASRSDASWTPAIGSSSRTVTWDTAVRRAKIVATLGPALDDPDRLRAAIAAGIDVVRLNFSHGTKEEHQRRLDLVHEIAASLGRNVGSLGDLQGPKIRLGMVPDEGVELVDGGEVVLVAGRRGARRYDDGRGRRSCRSSTSTSPRTSSPAR
jgi:hypothetical protein